MNTFQFNHLHLDNFLIGVWNAIQTSLIAVIIGGVVVWALLVVANWKIFTKAGEKGWKSLIPFYSDYIRFKLTWNTSFFWFLLAMGIVTSCISSTIGSDESLQWVNWLLLVVEICVILLHIIALYRLAKSFGHGIGFTIGLIFLPNIFTLILGFGKDEYKKLEK